MRRFLILLGYFELTMYLQLTGKLNQYINLHYAYLAYVSMILTFILAVVQLILWVKKQPQHSHLTKKTARLISFSSLLLPLFIGTFFPTVTLDATTVTAKGYHFPIASGNDSNTQEQEGTSTQYLKPDTSSFFTKTAYQKEIQKSLDKYSHLEHIEVTTDNYMEIMEAIYDFPDQFADKSISFTGFVYQDNDNPNNLFLFRFGIIHCIADSGVYGLLTTNSPQVYPNNTWVTVTGKITVTYHKGLNQTLPTVDIDTIQSVKEPDNPYVYRIFE